MKTHLELALDNRLLASQAPTPEWRIAILYYAAVHAVNHACFGAQQAPNEFIHRERKRWILRNLPSLSETYWSLEDLSRTARYRPDKHPMPFLFIEKARVLTESVFRLVGIPSLRNLLTTLP